MATSNNNITAVHFSLIFFVMLSIILGVVSYLKITEATVATNAANVARTEAEDAKKANNLTSDVAGRVMREIGYPMGTVIDGDLQTSLLAAIQADHNMVLGLYTRDEWNRLFQLNRPGNLRQDLFILKVAYDRVLEDKKKSSIQLTALKDAAVAAQTQAETARGKLEKEIGEVKLSVLKIERKAQEELNDKQKKVDQLAALGKQLRAERDEEREAHKNEIATFNKKVLNLRDTVARQRREIDDIKQVSFERADGTIRKVDYRTKLVWIDLGTADRLPQRLSFSVYSASHHGVGRGREDIKGAIEVTRIIGKNMAEARILDHDIYDPIRAGDPIYTPLWSAGTKESFAFVGFFDLDEDGQSDRDVLYRKVAAAGAIVSNAVDDNGIRTGTGMTTDDKFLVRGRTFDPDLAATKEEKAKRVRIGKELQKIEDEARDKGIRIIRLADFINFMGLRADRRLWRPGEGSPRKLKAGAASATVNQTIGNRQSSGRTSGIYSRSRRLKQPKSTGQTSKAYGGGRGGY